MRYSATVLRREADNAYRVKIDQGAELDAMVDLLYSRLSPSSGFIEIGAGAGGSFHVWSRILPLGPKVSVDYYDRASGDHVERWWGARDTRVHREALWQHHFEDVHPIFAPSADETTIDRVKKALGGRKVGFLFIDGRWQDIGCNFWWYEQFVRPGGIIAIHCIHQERPDAQPLRELWAHLKTLYQHCEYAYGPHRSGKKVGGTGVVFQRV